jgi:hypothetical protein
MKTLNSHIKEQEQFVLKEKFVLEILKFHKNRLDNPFHKIEKFKVNRKNDLLCVISHKLQQKYENIEFIKADDTIVDWKQMLIMSCCNHNIIANSSFSWWGAYFNTDRKSVV